MLGAFAAGVSLVAAPAASAEPVTVGFEKSKVANADVSHPTSLDFGPDGKLYVAQQFGTIKVLTVQRTGENAYSVVGTETVTNLIAGPDKLANHNDDGAEVGIGGRLVTGILAAGTAANPEIYVTSGDPRIGGGVGDHARPDTNLDTNSVVVSRLTRSGTGWKAQHLVRGLPRSEENHSANGMALSPDGGTLYVAQGGNTNNGAPSAGFLNLPEYALSAAILKIDLNFPKIKSGGTYDIPTLNRPETALPFGGNSGRTQARIVPGGPVQVHAPGFRNPYDIVSMQGTGKLFTIDNGANKSWGNLPVGEGGAGCLNAEQGTLIDSNPDELYEVTAPGTYGGHPNPTRGNAANLFDGQSPVPGSNPVECDHRVGVGALASFPTSTNGLAEYTSDRFGGAMQGDLLTVDYANVLWRVELNGAAKATSSTFLATAVQDKALDVAVAGDGTIWLADYGNWKPSNEPGSNPGGLWVVEPDDFGGAAADVCDPGKPDSDGDGYTNADEQLNGTNPCAKGDLPSDLDGDKVSDRGDADDDADGVADVVDAFARDAGNGRRSLPFGVEFENDDGGGGDALKVGFTGLMTNGTTDYLAQFDGANMTVGGAAGMLTLDKADPGDAYLGNTQKYAFQFGVAPGAAPFTVHARVVAPWAGEAPKNGQSMGVYVGTGDQDNYVKVVAAANGGSIVQAFREVGGVATQSRQPLTLPADAVDLLLRVDPRAGTVQPSFVRNPGGQLVTVGGPIAVPASWFTNPAKGLAVGIISTSTGASTQQAATWDFVRATPCATASGVAGQACAAVSTTTTPGTSPGTGQRPGSDRTAPRLTKLKLSRTRVRTRGRTRGTTVRFRLSEASRVTVSIARATTGRRVGRSCRKTTRSNRSARRCTRYVTVGRFLKAVPAGSRSIRFTGTIAGRRLAAGRYRMTVVATDAAGNRSKAVRATFRVIR